MLNITNYQRNTKQIYNEVSSHTSQNSRITYMWDLKNNGKMNSFTKQKQTHRSRKQTYGYQGASMGEINWEIGIDIYTLLEIEQITNKDLLYSTGNSSQYSVMAYMGK